MNRNMCVLHEPLQKGKVTLAGDLVDLHTAFYRVVQESVLVGKSEGCWEWTFENWPSSFAEAGCGTVALARNDDPAYGLSDYFQD